MGDRVSAPHEGILRALEPVEGVEGVAMAREPVGRSANACNLPLEIMEGSDGMITRDAICRLEETTTTAVNERIFCKAKLLYK